MPVTAGPGLRRANPPIDGPPTRMRVKTNSAQATALGDRVALAWIRGHSRHSLGNVPMPTGRGGVHVESAICSRVDSDSVNPAGPTSKGGRSHACAADHQLSS